MVKTPLGLSPTPPEGLSANPPEGLSANPPEGLSPTPPSTSTGKNRKQFYDDTVIGELGEGIASGVIGIGEGLIGLGTTVVDLARGTNYTDKVTEGAEAVRDFAGLDPEGFVGKGAELVTQYIVPGVGVAAKLGKAAKAARAAAGKTGPLSKGERFNQAMKEAAAFTGVEMAVSTDSTTTVGDWVDFGPTQTTDLIGLEGQEKALARLGNRLKIGVEGAGIGAGVQGLVSGTGKTVGMLAKTPQGKTLKEKTINTITPAAKEVSTKLNNAAKYLDDVLYTKMTDKKKYDALNLPGGDFFADAIAFVRYRGYLPEQVGVNRLLLDGQVQKKIKEADITLKKLDNSIKNTLNNLPPQSTLSEIDILNNIDDYLTETDLPKKARLLNKLPNSVRDNAREMRSHVDRLSNEVLNSNFLKRNNFVTKGGQSVEDLVKRNIGSYMRRQYKIFTDAKYKPTAEQLKVADDFFKTNKSSLEEELTDFARKDLDNVINDAFLQRNKLKRVGTGDSQKIMYKNLEGLRRPQVTDEAAVLARENFLSRYSLKKQDKLASGRVARDKLNTGVFLDRQNIPKTLRALLGEVTDPRESYISTISDLAQFNAIDRYFTTMTDLAKDSPMIGKLFRNGRGLTKAQRDNLRNSGYVELGGEEGASSILNFIGKEGDEMQTVIGRSGWGSLDGYFVPNEIYKNLTRQVVGDDNVGMQVLRGMFSTFLKGKALSQYSKTILSPVTQIRNFTTASAFALANGNVPFVARGGDLGDAVKIVYANIRNQGDDAILKELEEAQNLGILGTNAELREIQDSLRKGVGGYAEESRDGMTAMLGKTMADKVKKVTKPAEDIYQGSDDFWKFYNYKVEQAKIKYALKDSNLQEQIQYLTSRGDLSPELNSKLRNNINPKLVNDLIKQRSAQIVRDTVPNYNKAASELVTLMRKWPLGNFIVFPMEIYRTGFNIMRQAADEMSSPIEGIAARGRQRMMGLIGITTVLPAGLTTLGYALSGVSKEEMDTYQKYFAPKWEKGATLIPMGRDEDGKISYINFSTSNPYDTLGRAARRFFRELDTAKDQGKTPGQVLNDVGFSSVKEFFEPFLSEGMITEGLLDVTLRQGKTSTGAEVFDQEDNIGDKLGKSIAHVANTVLPNVIPAELGNVFSVTGFLEPKKIARSTLGGQFGIGIVNPKDKMGRDYAGMEGVKQLALSIAGISKQEFDPKKGLEFAAFRMQRAQNNARSQFNTLTDDANINSRSLYNGFVKANEAKLRVDREYYQIIKGLKEMGMKESDLRKILKQNKIGGVKSILRGKFEPFKITDNNKRELRNNDLLKELPREQINNLRRNLNGMPLDPNEEDFRTPQQPSNTVPKGLSPTPTVPKGLSPSPNVSVPPSPIPKANMATMSVQPGPVDPNLLGNNPATIQLAQRLNKI